MNKHFPLIGIVLILCLVTLRSTFFILPEGTQALIFQFGRVVKEPLTEAGLQIKAPFIQNVLFYEKRILNWDGTPERVPTADKKYIIVDTTARWRIVDALKFRNSLESITGAQSRIDNLINSATRDIISRNNLVEAVRNTNNILDTVSKRRETRRQAEVTGTLDQIEEEITGEIAAITLGRDRLSRDIIQSAQSRLMDYGIELIDVQLRRIAYEEDVEERVYDRMISERQRIAEKILSVGKGEQAKILGKISKDLQEIESKAYRQVQEIEGEADARAIKIYADAVGGDQEFYQFIRGIDAYDAGLRSDANLITSSNAAFLKLLKEGP